MEYISHYASLSLLIPPVLSDSTSHPINSETSSAIPNNSPHKLYTVLSKNILSQTSSHSETPHKIKIPYNASTSTCCTSVPASALTVCSCLSSSLYLYVYPVYFYFSVFSRLLLLAYYPYSHLIHRITRILI